MTDKEFADGMLKLNAEIALIEGKKEEIEMQLSEVYRYRHMFMEQFHIAHQPSLEETLKIRKRQQEADLAGLASFLDKSQWSMSAAEEVKPS